MRRTYWVLLALVLLLTMLFVGSRAASALHAAVGLPSITPPPVIVSQPNDEAEQVKTVDVEFATLRCTYAGDGDPGRLGAREVGGGATVLGKTEGATLRIDLAPGEWEIRWIVGSKDRRLSKVRIDAGEQRTCTLGETVDLVGNVKTPDGKAVEGARVRGCGTSTTTSTLGHWQIEHKQGTGCQLRAEWTDGLLRRYSNSFYYDPFQEPGVIDLILDNGPVGGVGLTLGPSADGVMVEDVIAATPSDRAGMLPGDLITDVDGKPIRGMGLESVVNTIVGQPGTRVVLSIERDGKPMKLTLEREHLEHPVDTGVRPAPAQ